MLSHVVGDVTTHAGFTTTWLEGLPPSGCLVVRLWINSCPTATLKLVSAASWPQRRLFVSPCLAARAVLHSMADWPSTWKCLRWEWSVSQWHCCRVAQCVVLYYNVSSVRTRTHIIPRWKGVFAYPSSCVCFASLRPREVGSIVIFAPWRHEHVLSTLLQQQEWPQRDYPAVCILVEKWRILVNYALNEVCCQVIPVLG